MNHTIRATWAQCKSEMLRTARNKRFVVFSVLMPIAFFFIFTGTMNTDVTVDGVDWIPYYLMSMTAYGVIGASLTSFAPRIAKERAQGWIRLLRITPLPSGSYVLSKIAAQAVINIVIVVLVFGVAGISKGIDLPVSVWIESGLWIWLGGFAFMALATLVGSMRNADAVQVLSMILYLGMSVMGGLWMPTSTFPKLMQEIAKWLPTYRVGQGAWNLVGGGHPDWAGFGILAAYALIFVIISSYIMKEQEAV